MRAAAWFSASLLLVACNGEQPLTCTLPEGCNSTSSASGRCECVDWQVVSDDVVPLKFLVVGVVEGAPGDQSQVAVGDYGALGGGLPADGHSQFGTRVRAVFRDSSGKETPLAAEVASGSNLVALGATTVAFDLSNGFGLGGGNDVKEPSSGYVLVWMNPTLRVVRDAGGNLRAVWGWSGNCFDPTTAACSSPAVAMFPRQQLESPPGTYGYDDSFLRTLSDAERASIVTFDRLGTTPPPTVDEIAADPRFERIADFTVDTGLLLSPDTTWTPCTSVASDGDFPVYASTAASIPGGLVLVQQSWLSTTTNCSPQRPGLVVGTDTPGCAISATAYVDRMFGGLAFLTTLASPACIGQP